jgi:predicted peroxiredoxin
VLAVILETADPERLYTGLSLAVSAAAEGEPVRVLLGFGALAAQPGPGTHVVEAERDAFARTLAELWATARELCEVWACSAAAQAVDADAPPVMSMPQFVREAAHARLVVV